MNFTYINFCIVSFKDTLSIDGVTNQFLLCCILCVEYVLSVILFLLVLYKIVIFILLCLHNIHHWHAGYLKIIID